MKKFKVTVTRVDEYEIEIDENNLDKEIDFPENSEPIDLAKDLALTWMRTEDKYFKEGYGYIKELDKDGKVKGIPYTKEDGEFGYPLPDDRYTTGITIKPLSQDEDYEIDAIVVS